MVHSDRVGGAQVERAHLDVVDAAFGERDERPGLARFARLRANRAVVLVLDLQDVRVELAVVAVDDDTDGRVARLRVVTALRMPAMYSANEFARMLRRPWVLFR